MSITLEIFTIYSTLTTPSYAIHGSYLCDAYYANDSLFASFHYTDDAVSMSICNGVRQEDDATILICKHENPQQLIVECKRNNDRPTTQTLRIFSSTTGYDIDIYCRKITKTQERRRKTKMQK